MIPREAGNEENRDEEDDDAGEERPRRAGGERPFFSGRRDHLGRRRLARREGCGERVAARERPGDLHGRRRPRARVLLEAAQDHALDGRVEAREDVRGRRRRLLLVLAAHLGERGRVERALAGRDLVEDEAERVEIAPHGRRLARELLGRHVRRRARDLAQRSGLFGGHREPEVRDPHAPAPVEHDVRGLEVAVEDALLVRRVQARAELARDLDGLVDGETPDPLEQRRQVLAVHVLHREEVAAFDLADVVDAADVRVRDLPREPHLGVEAREKALVRRDRLGQELQGDRLSELEVVGAVDLAHAALSEKPDER